jgi:uncharacterized membrane protein
MSDSNEKINRLQERLDKMVEYQDYFYREINLINDELRNLKTDQTKSKAAPKPELPIEPSSKSPLKPEAPLYQPPPKTSAPKPATEPERTYYSKYTAPASVPPSRAGLNLEEFVGRNLISLIGIIITVIGVSIGAKYAIDRDLISPATRILLGYLFAAGLFGTAIWLKKKYLNFSAVLLSGSLAIIYFLTFFAYSYYALIPQRLAFALMLFFTAFTVAAAINYNRQVIAHIGLVGAYAVPFLLSNDSGRADILFGYMTIINFGILAISLKKFWKPLYYSSFIFTWSIYSAWYLADYRAAEHFPIAFGFALIFFLTFYLTFFSYKLIAREEFNPEIVVLVLINSFIFYGFGYATLDSRDDSQMYLGMFTLANALLNFLVAFVIHKYQLGDRKNFYLAIALAVTFLTIAVPVQFEGSWVTLIWTAEAASLFWIGRTKRITLYENLSYPLMFLASTSLLNDWQNAFFNEAVLTPIFNRNFTTSILFAAAFGFITFVNRNERYKSSVKDIDYLLNFIVPTIFLFVLYNAFRIEIGNYFHSQIVNTAIGTIPQSNFSEAVYRKDGELSSFNLIWQINYSMLFLTVLSFINIKRIKSATLGFVNLGLNVLTLLVFLIVSLYLIAELRMSYLTQPDASIFPRGVFHIFIRYVSFAFVAALIFAGYEYIKQEFLTKRIPRADLSLAFDFVFHVALLWIASSELLNLMDIFGFNDSHKLGLSILWGIYALVLIVLGIIKKKKHLRIGAIALFAGTLVKLFFYDIAELDTVSKTIVFVSLGVLLLIISFLYNKYKDLIFEKDES